MICYALVSFAQAWPSVPRIQSVPTIMRVNLQALGCRLNEAELQQWASDFQKCGHEITRDIGDADLLVVNTCAVTGEAVRKSRQMIRRARRNNPQARLVVSGCYATLEQQKATDMEGVDLVVPNQHKDKLVQRIHDELLTETIQLSEQWSTRADALLQRGRSRAFIKVQDGCRWRCSYCIVTLARGKERSIPIPQIIEQINRYSRQGIQEIVLTGVHLGGYGSDLGTDLYSLTQAVLHDTDMPRIRFGSLEPWDLHQGFFDLFEDQRLMPHLHLPLQSGSNSVLKRMARRCKTQDFFTLVQSARGAIPGFNVTTDIIIGFPGETEKEWRQGYDFIESVGFGHVHIFSFSVREGTKAAGLADQVADGVIKQRSQQLHQLADRMSRDFLRQYDGATVAVLLEDNVQQLKDGRFRYTGYTPNYLSVEYVAQASNAGRQIVTGCLHVRNNEIAELVV